MYHYLPFPHYHHLHLHLHLHLLLLLLRHHHLLSDIQRIFHTLFRLIVTQNHIITNFRNFNIIGFDELLLISSHLRRACDVNV